MIEISNVRRIENTYLLKACYYVKNHRVSYDRFLHILHYLNWNGTSVTRDKVYVEAEKRGLHVTDNITFARDHNLFAVLSRFAIMSYPHLIRNLHPRKSIVDDLDLAFAWEHLTGDYILPLKIRNWKDAEKWLREND